MEEILRGYDVNNATWFYLSLLLIVAVYFRFGRFFTLRNLDLALLLSMSPGVLLVQSGYQAGYAWLFVSSGILLLRLCGDAFFIRRPRLEQNLNAQGLTFLCVAAFAFLTAEAISADIPDSAVETVVRADALTKREDPTVPVDSRSAVADKDMKAGPAATVLTAPIAEIGKALGAANGVPEHHTENLAAIAARLAAMVAHLAVVLALIMLARLHFEDTNIGLAMATLYLLLPCTSYEVGEINHVLPAALILWALVAYKRPMAAGSLMGLACGTLFFPIFLLPLWARFYGWRGAIRFGLALAITGAVLVGSLVFTSADALSFKQQTLGSIDFNLRDWLSFGSGDTEGFWNAATSPYRIPVFVAFLVLTAALTIWPTKKNFEHLIAHSTAIVVGTQFWYPQQGGIYLLWYLPLLLVVVFRPALAHLLPPDMTPVAREGRPTTQPALPELVTSGPPSTRLYR
jgi:hypothetical protein